MTHVVTHGAKLYQADHTILCLGPNAKVEFLPSPGTSPFGEHYVKVLSGRHAGAVGWVKAAHLREEAIKIKGISLASIPTKLSYLASPYSSGGLGHMGANFYATERLVEQLLFRGYNVVSPILHNHALTQNPESPLSGWITHHPWQKYNESLLRCVEQLLIFRLGDWKSSRGVQHEIDFFTQLRGTRFVFFVDEDLTTTPFGSL